MAEILLSLTIIGVVAAITLPSLTGNINERVWNTQRKALYARFSQAIALMPQLNGYGTLIEVPKASTFGLSIGGGATDDVEMEIIDTAAETFLTEGLSKVLKINNICDNEHLLDCGLPDKITPLNTIDGNLGETTINSFPKTLSELKPSLLGYREMASTIGVKPVRIIDSKAAAFETQNGESIAVYYNPHCTNNTPVSKNDGMFLSQSRGPLMCANFIYDLNGKKGPNAVGKDIGFLTVFNTTEPNIVAPHPLPQNIAEWTSQIDAGNACKAMDSESRVPNIDELAAMDLNNRILGIDSGRAVWSSTVIRSGEATGEGWVEYFHGSLERNSVSRDTTLTVRCIKK